MLPRLFIDTSVWYAIADKGDSNHQLALIYRHQIARKYKLITSNYILDELYTLLSFKR
jgi:predicted nucleic acid-binding protein